MDAGCANENGANFPVPLFCFISAKAMVFLHVDFPDCLKRGRQKNEESVKKQLLRTPRIWIINPSRNTSSGERGSAMKKAYLWYLAGAVVVFLPVGWRVLSRPSAPQEEVNVAMADAGKTLFTHEWTANDSLSPGGDGLGPVFNANSCAACHHQGGVGGSGGLDNNVTLFSIRSGSPGGMPREGVLHAKAIQGRVSLAQIQPGVQDLSAPSLEKVLSFNVCNNSRVRLSQRNTPALFGAKLIDDIPDRVIIAQERKQRLAYGLETFTSSVAPVGLALRLPDGRIGKFGWKAQSPSLNEFVQLACANELGLGNPGQAQPTPFSNPNYQPPGLDLTLEQCNQLTAFVASLPRPQERLSENIAKDEAHQGKKLFSSIGCAACHTPNLGSVEGIYSDLLLHRMGDGLEGEGSYGQPTPKPQPSPGEGVPPDSWRTPPLWGVADSAPYLHDGRAPTLEEAIRLHGGQAANSRGRFNQLSEQERSQVIHFLKSLRSPVAN
jgi:CxxC motif-containing protein (DUF1111 family)